MIKKETLTHHDIVGQEITVDSHVAVPKSNSLFICKVVKLNPKMIKVVNVKSVRKKEWLVYPRDTLAIGSADALAYILKNSK